MNTAGNYPEPTYIGAVGNQDLHADRNIDYVIFVPSSGALNAAAERLAQMHRTRLFEHELREWHECHELSFRYIRVIR